MNKKDIDKSAVKIPLKVKKPIKNNKKSKMELPLLKEDKTSFQILSTVKILSVLILLVISMNLIINIVLEIDKNKSGEIISEQPSIEKNSDILGSWITEKDSLFVFDNDNTFYWYDNYEEKNNNYYHGTFTYKTGLEALEEMGYTEEDLQVSFDDVKLENVYSIIMKPTTLIKGKKDLTKKEISPNETWWFLIIKKDDGTALGYNKTLDIRYDLKTK